MTLNEILANETLRQIEFPVTRRQVFLAHAGVCPLPRRVSEAIGKYAALAGEGDQEACLPDRELGQTRALAARLLGAQPQDIALVGPTSLALSYVAAGLPFRAGDNVVCYAEDYPSNVYPWAALAERGVEVRRIQTAALGEIGLADVVSRIDRRTRLVALASCHFVSGYRIDLAELGTRLRESEIWFCVDAIQTLGAFPVSVEHVDVLAADAHKWLLGPSAAGLLYINPEVRQQLQPVVFGWHNVACPEFITQDPMQFRGDGRRYEAGSHNLLGYAGLEAALELLLGLGVEAIASELLRKRAWLIPRLVARGYGVLHPSPPERHTSGIISFARAGLDMAAVWRQLQSVGIVTSLRADRLGNRYVRISPHFYNTDAELGQLLEQLPG